jgi:CRP-like cAMP-binding protein
MTLLPLKYFFDNRFGTMPDKEWEQLSSIVQVTVVKKGEHLHKIGIHCKHFWYLQQGAIRVYKLYNDESFTTHFFIEDNIFVDYESILTQKPSNIAFIAEEDCTIFAMAYLDLINLYNASPYLERLGRIMAERQFTNEFELRQQLLHATAQQRYQMLLQQHPYIFQRFALKHIANYLGITPASLSRIRAYK